MPRIGTARIGQVSLRGKRQLFRAIPVLVGVAGGASGGFPRAMGEDLDIRGEMAREAIAALPIYPQGLKDAPARRFLGSLVRGRLLRDRSQPADFFTKPVECGTVLSSQSLVLQCRAPPGRHYRIRRSKPRKGSRRLIDRPKYSVSRVAIRKASWYTMTGNRGPRVDHPGF